MTVYQYILKHGITCTNWQILAIKSLIPFDFVEVFNGKTWDLMKEKKLNNRIVISYFRSLNFNKYILVIADIGGIKNEV